MSNPLVELKKAGQSVWYDNLNRELIVTGKLKKMVEEDGVSGGTSNPSIFEKAVGASDVYDDHIRELLDAGHDLEGVFDGLTVKDIQESAGVFKGSYEESKAVDGYASLEVSPHLAYDTEGTIEAARRLFKELGRPNAMIKIPGTQEGLPAIEQCLADGLNINITLLFGVENYEQVAWTYVSALEKRWSANQPIDRIASVASFFVSRVDTMVDDQLKAKIEQASSEAEKEHLRNLLGKAAVANAKIAYQKFKEVFSSTRWQVLAENGAHVQRCLWASTSTKNPDYPDTIYVEPLIGPDTINTMPQVTLDAFREHGEVALTIEDGVDEAEEQLRQIEEAGISLKKVTEELQTQGVKLFADSYDGAMNTLAQKRDAILGAGATARD